MSEHNDFQKFDANCGPLSLVITEGTPKISNHFGKIFFAVPKDVKPFWSAGSTTVYPECRSTARMKQSYVLPSQTAGAMWKTSIAMLSPMDLGMGVAFILILVS